MGNAAHLDSNSRTNAWRYFSDALNILQDNPFLIFSMDLFEIPQREFVILKTL